MGRPKPTAENYISGGKALMDHGLFAEAIELFKEAVARDPQLDRNFPLFWYAWEGYVLQNHAIPQEELDAGFLELGIKDGQIDEEIQERLRAALFSAPTYRAVPEDYIPGYVVFPTYGDVQDQANRNHRFVQLGPKQLDAIRPVLEALAAPVRACKGTPWRVVNVKAWRTLPGAEEFGMNAWHLDGHLTCMNKVLVYVTGAGDEEGTTQIKLPDETVVSVEGAPGAWCYFRNNDLWHRGVGPTKGERMLLDITLSPNPTMDLEPVPGGQVSYYPKLPWAHYRAEDNLMYQSAWLAS